MKTSAKKVTDLTVDEPKSVIHEVIAEDTESWRQTFEILSDKKLMKQLRQADSDWARRDKDCYVSWDDLKNVRRNTP